MSAGNAAWVECACPHRKPVPGKVQGGRFGPWECGHDDGCLVSVRWHNLAYIGRSIHDVLFVRGLGGFPIFRKAIGRTPPGYVGDYLELTVSEAEAWFDEFEQIRGLLRGEYFHDWHTTEQLQKSILEPVAHVYQFVDNRLVPLPGQEFSEDKFEEVLHLGERICWASIESRNPIALLW